MRYPHLREDRARECRRIAGWTGLSCAAACAVITILVGAGSALAQSKDALQVLMLARPEVRWSRATSLRADFDCDGLPDQAFLGRGGGRVYVGIVRSGRQRPEVLDFAVAHSVQNAICEEPAVLSIETLADPTEAVGKIEGFRPSKRCKGLLLEGGQCDPVHLFWNFKTRRIEWWRA